MAVKTPKELWRRILRWLESRRPKPPNQEPQQPDAPTPPPPPAQPRYEVKSESGKQAAKADTLAEAHEKWQKRTHSRGSIIDTQTGEDVTPPPDDNGRYVVLDQQTDQVGSFDKQSQAEEIWQARTNGQGRIIDTKTGKDVTPRNRVLSPEQMDTLHALFGNRGPRGHNNLDVDASEVRRMTGAMNNLPIPVFDVTNIAGKGNTSPTRTVPITRRKVTIELVRKAVEVEVAGRPRPSGRLEVPYPTDEPELKRMRGVSDLRRVPTRSLALPPSVLRQRIARRQLLRRTFEEEIPGQPIVQKRKVWQEVEEPKVHEWTEEVEVTEDPQAQLLEIVIDVSDSMRGRGICMALALAGLVIGRHLEDDSRYFWRSFANEVSDVTKALTPQAKGKLLKDMLQQEHDLGGGTDILTAITKAAEDVRKVAKSTDRPEVLLITDGMDTLSAEAIYEAVGEDVILHTVVVNAYTNASLKKHSSTYYELYCDGGRVKGSKGRRRPTTYARYDW